MATRIKIMGIDPGQRGGIVVLDNVGHLEYMAIMPDVQEFVRALAQYHIFRCYIEKAQAMPHQGAASMFNYGKHYGELCGVLAALQISYHPIAPRTWQGKMLGKHSKGDSKKEALKKAKQLWPKQDFVPDRCRVAHDGIVDAALIAEYGRMLHVAST